MKNFSTFILIVLLFPAILSAFSLSSSLIKAGEKCIEEKNFIEAQKVFATITVLEPENNKARSKLIQALLETKDFKKALREVHMALSYEENSKDFLKLKDELEGKVKLEENPELIPKPSGTAKIRIPKYASVSNLIKLKSKASETGISAANRKNFETAHGLYEKQKYKEALEIFEKILKSPADKDNLTVNQYAGEAFFWLGNYEKAIELLKKIVTAEKKNIEARLIISYAYMTLKTPEYAKALEHFEEILKIKANHLSAMVGAGTCHMKTGNDVKAETIFNQVIALAPAELKAYYGLSEIYLKKKNFDKAMEFLHSALIQVPDSYETIEKIGDIYVQMKDLKTAAYIYRKAMDFSPSNPDLYGKLCITLLLSKQNFTCGLYLGRALELDPENDVIHYAYGMFWEANMDFEKAVNSYRKVLSINPHHIDARFFLINLLMGKSNVFPNAAEIYSDRMVQVRNVFDAEEHIQKLYSVDKTNIYKVELKDYENTIFNMKADLEEKDILFNEMYDVKVKKNN